MALQRARRPQGHGATGRSTLRAMPRRIQPAPPSDPTTAEIEAIIAAADALIRRRLAAKKIRAVHFSFAVTETGLAILRGNADGDSLASMAADLAEIAEQTRERRPGEMEH